MENNKPTITVWEGLPGVSGGQRVILDLVQGLRDRYRFRAIVPSAGELSDNFNKLGIPVRFIAAGDYTLGGKKVSDIIKFLYHTPSVLWKGTEFIRGSDLIYANSTRVFVWSTITGGMLDIPVIWHLHNLLVDRKTKYLVNSIGKLKNVKKIIAVSRAAKEQFPELAGKTETIYNGVDVSRFQPSVEERRDRAEKRIGIIADLIPQKGHETLLKAVSMIRGQISLKLFVTGKARKGMEWCERNLKDLVHTLQLDENVEFLGYRQDIPEILKSLDLLVVPSSSFEACPMVVLEAFACGIPVIGSDLGGNPELIEDGKTGFIFKAGNPQDLAEKISKFFSDRNLWSDMAKECRRTAEEKFNIRGFLEKLGKILEDLIG